MRRTLSWLFSLGLITVIAVGWFERYALYDWWQLRNYTPPAAVVQLTTDTTMTPATQHLFYVNHPLVEGRDLFNQSCPNNGGEQTIVLGCYHDHERGIFVFDVTDSRLSGVEQVTTAHEALHALYERLSTKDKNYVNGLLQDFYQNGLQDQRIKDTVAAYQKSEPNDVVNEMHSIFGTEVRDLPASLEDYYKRYFTDRKQIVAYSEKYESAFTSINDQAEQIKNRLSSLKASIDQLKGQLSQEAAALARDRASISSQAQADAFNVRVRAYNNQVAQLDQQIAEYNSLLDQYKQLAVQQKQLFQAIDSRQTTLQPQ